MMDAFVLILFTIFIFKVDNRTALNRNTQFPFTGTILKTSYGDQYQVDFSGVAPGSDINIKFQINTPSVLTSTFLAVSSNQTKFKSGKVYITSLYGLNYTVLQGNMDVGSMQLGKTQYINRKKYDSSDDVLYFTIYNMDPQYRCVDIQFTISINIDTSPGNTLDCYTCLNHGRRQFPSQSCICQRCDAGYYGPDCSINLLSLTSGQSTTTVINGPGMAFFKIDQANQIAILVKISVGVGQIYFQFIDFDGQFAAYTNVAQGRSTQGRFNVTAGTSGTTFNAVSSGTKMSLTVAIYNATPTTVQVSYTVSQKSNVLLIVLAVLGSVLFVGLVIAAIYIVRNSSWFQNGRQTRQVRPITENLNDEEIERFFPTVFLKNVTLISHDESNIELNENQSPNKSKINVEDCVICLCPIQPQQQIKVTYCKHIFHGVCLVGWFKKQQNCPYCRQEFTRSNTIKLYKKIKQINNGSIIKGEQLVNAILSQAKSVVIASKDSLEQLNEKETQKVKIGSRNSVQIENLS